RDSSHGTSSRSARQQRAVGGCAARGRSAGPVSPGSTCPREGGTEIERRRSPARGDRPAGIAASRRRDGLPPLRATLGEEVGFSCCHGSEAFSSRNDQAAAQTGQGKTEQPHRSKANRRKCSGVGT